MTMIKIKIDKVSYDDDDDKTLKLMAGKHKKGQMEKRIEC